MSEPQAKPGVVVLGSDFKALGIVRSLGRRGIPCYVVDNVPRSAWFSRYTTQRIKWHGERMDGPLFLSFLLSLSKHLQLDQWILLPTDDTSVGFVARHTHELSRFYLLATQDWNVIRWAHDKRLTYRMAEDVGVPAPRTWYPTSEEDLDQMGILFPVILKPAVSINLQHVVRIKALPVTTRDELFTHYRRIAQIIPPEEIMLQEIIPGNGLRQFSVATFCEDGEIRLSMTARRTRQYPIHYGLGSSFVEAIEIPGLCDLAAKIVRHMRVTGMVEVEFKQDPRSGDYKVLDINVRPWGWHTLCMACGLDFPFIHYSALHGESPTPQQPRYDYCWIRAITDIPAGIQEIRFGDLSLDCYLRSLLKKITFSVWDWRDPLPAFGDMATVLQRALRGAFKQKV